MGNDLIEKIKRTSFEKFRAENSHLVDDSMINSSLHCFVICPEKDYPLALEKLLVKGGIYVAVSGSVNPPFGHISEIQPELSILLDINDAAIDYLRFRGTLLEAGPNGYEYWNRLGRLWVPYNELTEEMIEASCDGRLPVGLPVKVLEILLHEKGRREAIIEAKRRERRESYPLQSDMPIKSYIDFSQFHKILDLKPETVIELERDIQIGGWSSPNRYSKVRKAWGEGRIKGVTGDFTSGGFALALDISSKSGVPITLVYISNIDDYWSPVQRNSLVTLIKEGLERNLFHPQCKVIDWWATRTRVHTVQDYVHMVDY